MLSPTNSAKYLGEILSSIGDGVMVLDQDGVIEFANPAAAQIFQSSALVGTDSAFVLVGDKNIAGPSVPFAQLSDDVPHTSSITNHDDQMARNFPWK